MGIGLIKEVLTCAPDDLGPAERMVMMAIAEDARDATRESWSMTPAELGKRAGLKPSALQKAFQRLAKYGLEVRVAIKVGKDGRPVYAYEGKKTTYRIPVLKRVEQEVPSEGGTDSTLSSSQEGGTESSQGGTQSTLWPQEGGTESSEGGTDSTPTPQYPSTTSPTEKKAGGAGGKRASADDEHPRFAEFYNDAYPKKADPGTARKAFNRAVKKVGDPQVLIDGARRYAKEKAGTQSRFIKAPAVWLNAEAWANEPEVQRPLAATGTDGIQGYGIGADTSKPTDRKIRI
jgi:predicted transcriptional regulator